MREVRIAHFRHRHEADLARGFLDQAGIPCRLLSDDTAGGVAYIGGLAGAWVIVPGPEAEEAVAVLESAGIHLGAEEPTGPAVDLARRADTLPPVARADLADLTHALERAQKKEFRHFVGCMLGAIPAAVIPLVGLSMGGEAALVVLLTCLIILTEGRKALRSANEVKRLEAALVKLDEETREE